MCKTKERNTQIREKERDSRKNCFENNEKVCAMEKSGYKKKKKKKEQRK